MWFHIGISLLINLFFIFRMLPLYLMSSFKYEYYISYNNTGFMKSYWIALHLHLVSLSQTPCGNVKKTAAFHSYEYFMNDGIEGGLCMVCLFVFVCVWLSCSGFLLLFFFFCYPFFRSLFPYLAGVFTDVLVWFVRFFLS